MLAIIFGTKGEYPYNFCNHKGIGNALTKVVRNWVLTLDLRLKILRFEGPRESNWSYQAENTGGESNNSSEIEILNKFQQGPEMITFEIWFNRRFINVNRRKLANKCLSFFHSFIVSHCGDFWDKLTRIVVTTRSYSCGYVT